MKSTKIRTFIILVTLFVRNVIVANYHKDMPRSSKTTMSLNALRMHNGILTAWLSEIQ